jgi:hypothetical protein
VSIFTLSRSKFDLEEPLYCSWIGIFALGDEIIKAKYFKNHGCGDKTYVFYNKIVNVHVDAHFVEACKFSMVLTLHRIKDSPVYMMSNKSMRVCEDALQN